MKPCKPCSRCKETGPQTIRDRYRALLAQFAQEANVPLDAVLAGSRLRRLCWARWKAWQSLRDRGLTLGQIGRIAGGFDHTTILSGIRSLARWPEPPPVGLSGAKIFAKRYGWNAFLPPVEELRPAGKMQPCETAQERLRKAKLTGGAAHKNELARAARGKISLDVEQSPAFVARINEKFVAALAAERARG